MAVTKNSGVLTEMADHPGCRSDSYNAILRVARGHQRGRGRFAPPPRCKHSGLLSIRLSVNLCAIVGGANAQASKNSYDEKRRQSTALTIVYGNLADYSDSNGRNA